MRPKARLVSHTKNPVGTILFTWVMSRSYCSVPSPEEWEDFLRGGKLEGYSLKDLGFSAEEEGARREARELFANLLEDDVPVLEMAEFVFSLDCPIALREQLVRHRVGVRFGGTEYLWGIPNLTDSSFWVQSSRARVLDVSEEEFFIPRSIGEDEERKVVMREVLGAIKEGYDKLLLLGCPPEDARYIIPTGTFHTLVWATNLRSLKQILRSRSCWLAQSELWGSIIRDVVQGLVSVSPLLRYVAYPPCVRRRKYRSCPAVAGVEERLQGRDPNPPCPLAMANEWLTPSEDPRSWKMIKGRGGRTLWEAPSEEARRRMREHMEEMKLIWGGGGGG